VIPLKGSEELLGLCCCLPLTPSLREYLILSTVKKKLRNKESHKEPK
jgi:hypothetical protein